MAASRKSVDGVARARQIETGFAGFSKENATHVSPPATALLSSVCRSIFQLPRRTKRLIMIGADAIMLPIAFWVALCLQYDAFVALSPFRD